MTEEVKQPEAQAAVTTVPGEINLLNSTRSVDTINKLVTQYLMQHNVGHSFTLAQLRAYVQVRFADWGRKVEGRDPERVLDARVQKLRKEGFIEFGSFHLNGVNGRRTNCWKKIRQI